MIRINKKVDAPTRLLTVGKTQTKKLCAEYDSNPSLYKARSLKPKKNIYNHESVKKSLKILQRNKCCFCEKDQIDEIGAVEHFRPQKAFKSVKSKPNEFPGYYWLTYEWTNLYFVCTNCNTFKGSIFPLVDERKRARNHHYDVTRESPLLIEPSTDNPRDHVGFDQEQPKGLTRKGRTTIAVCNLDRDGLTENRRERLGMLKAFKKIVMLPSEAISTVELAEIVVEAKQFLENAVKPDAPFSSMAIDFINE